MLTHVDNRITYSGNGNTTEFAYQFKILDRTDIKVLLTDADGKEKLLTKDYYVDVEKNVVRYPGYAVGAEVPESERPPVLPTGWKLTIYREVPVTQETDLPDQYPFNQVEDIGDKLTMIAQQLTDVTGRSLKIGVSTSADIDTTIPWENGKSFRISDDGKTLELSEDPAKVLPLAQSKLEAATAQANIAAASAAAAAKSEDSAAASASEAGNSAQSASVSAASAAESARLAEGYKNVAEAAKSDASLYAANAKTSADNAGASKEAAQSAATTASNFASDARNSAGEAKTYMDNAKNYSENVNVFVPSVSTEGVLSWTNKAGLTNPASVNIKGAKGDTGTAASITIGSVTTGAAGSNASVTNSGTASNVVLNFMLPRGKDGKDGGITVDAALSDTSINPVQNKVVKAALDAKVNKTDKIYEANLAWGGRNIVANFSPIDAAIVPFLGANRFAFGKAGGITVEYSTDAGATWLDYGLSDVEKVALLTQPNKQIHIGKAPDNPLTPMSMLRISIHPKKLGLYTVLNKFIMLVSTNGCYKCYCTIDASLKSNPTTFRIFADKVRISGWSGWNVINIEELITYQSGANSQYDNIRFTFGCSEVTADAYAGLGVYCILGFGGVGWDTPSNMAANGHLYSFNASQDAFFPAAVTAPTFIGNLTGTATGATKAQRLALQAGTTNANRPVIFQDSANYAGELLANRCSTFQYNPATDNLTVGKINGFTIETSVPANAKFTDTVYTHPPTHPADMITGLADVAKSGSYNDLTNKPTIVKTVNNVAPDSKGNVDITVSGVTIDEEISGTSTNPVQNKAIYNALLGKVETKNIFYGFDLGSPTAAIRWRIGSQVLGSLTASNYTGTALRATQDGENNVITETYAKKSTANTWGKTQTFEKAICKEVTIAKEIYGVSYTDGGAITLATNVVHHVANSEVTLDMAQAITDFLSVDATSTVFSIYITTLDDSAAYPLIITNAGTLKYVGNASDFAITGAGLLLNILMLKNSSGNVTSIVQASKLEGGA